MLHEKLIHWSYIAVLFVFGKNFKENEKGIVTHHRLYLVFFFCI